MTPPLLAAARAAGILPRRWPPPQLLAAGCASCCRHRPWPPPPPLATPLLAVDGGDPDAWAVGRRAAAESKSSGDRGDQRHWEKHGR